MIIGGREQGKLSFAADKYKLSADDICDCSQANLREISKAGCVYRLHEYVRRLIKNDLAEEADSDIESELDLFNDTDYGEIFDDSDFLDMLISRFREDAVIICDEVGLGVVPISEEERIYRQAVGRLCCRLAQKADCVERVFCGIAVRIK